MKSMAFGEHLIFLVSFLFPLTYFLIKDGILVNYKDT